MKALSIQQPWAWLIANGRKDIENRSWPTNVRGWVLVHAGKKIDNEGIDFLLENFPTVCEEMPDQFATGGIVGAMYIADCVEEHGSKWFFGPHGFVIEKAVVLPFIPLRGQLGFFDVPRDLLPSNLAELLK